MVVPRTRFAPVKKNTDLLAIVLRSGTRSLTVTQMAERLLNRFGGLEGLDRSPVSELCRVPGMGEAKSAQLKAALELGRRLRKQGMDKGTRVRSPQDIVDVLRLEMGALEHEQFRLVLLDTKNRIVDIKTLYEGSLNSTSIRTAEIFREAVRQNCASIIAAHNHPSGDPAPSPEDIRVTEELVKAGKLLDIEVLDHVVIGGGDSYVSLKARGLGFR
jgi:DNA repair protein RadC